MDLSGERETDACFCCRGRGSESSTKWRPYRSENCFCGRCGTRSLDVATIPKASRASNTRPLSSAGPNCSRQPLVYRKEGTSFGDAEPVASPWGIPEPRFLQGTGNGFLLSTSRESSPVARNLLTTLPYHAVVWRRSSSC